MDDITTQRVAADGSEMATVCLPLPPLEFNRYELLRELGRGGTGVVWMAHDRVLGAQVALKTLRPEITSEASALRELKSEVLINRTLSHPHIVRTYDFVTSERSSAISMEFVSGTNLHRLKSERPKAFFEAEEIAAWMYQLCDAMEYAHRCNVVHRDVKPANLMIDEHGHLKVGDFGIGQTATDTVRGMTRKSSGTPPFMSPQQTMGERAVPADDIYGIGATIYDLLTGDPPFFRGAIREQALAKVAPSMTERRKELGREGAPIPPHWEAAVAAALSKEAGGRPPSAAAFRTMLEKPALAAVAGTGAQALASFPPAAAAVAKPVIAGPAKPEVKLPPPAAQEPPPASGRKRLRRHLAWMLPAALLGGAGATVEAWRLHLLPASLFQPYISSAPAAPASPRVREASPRNRVGQDPTAAGRPAPTDTLDSYSHGNAGANGRGTPADALNPSADPDSGAAAAARAQRTGASGDASRPSPRSGDTPYLYPSPAPRYETAIAGLPTGAETFSSTSSSAASSAGADSSDPIAQLVSSGRVSADEAGLLRRALNGQQGDFEQALATRLAVRRSLTAPEWRAFSALVAPANPIIAQLRPLLMAGAIRENEFPFLAQALAGEKGPGEAALASRLVETRDLTPGQWRQQTALYPPPPVDPIVAKLKPWLASNRLSFSEASWIEAALRGSKSPAEKTLAEALIDRKTLTPYQWRARTALEYPLSAITPGPATTWPPAIDLPLSSTVTLRLLRVDPGTFQRGTPANELGRRNNEPLPAPVHIDSPFYLGMTEVTQAQYAALMPHNPSYWRGHPDWPVDQVDWHSLTGANGFLERLNHHLSGLVNGALVPDLPTSDEWEYACRAGTESAFYAGSGIESLQRDHTLDKLANYNHSDEGSPCAVGSFQPNAWGFYDMLGNVAEWCRDRYVRGGSFQSTAAGCRIGWHTQSNADSDSDPAPTQGFRLLLRAPAE